MKLSIVATLYKSAPYIHEFVDRACRAAEELASKDYEIILVNDGSPDDSLKIAVNLTQENPHLIVVDLSRNFGHHKAILAGLSTAVGGRIFVIDIDLEEAPELIIDFWRIMDETSTDLVNGKQISRKGGLFERVSGEIFYRIFNILSDFKIEPNLTIAKLLTARFKSSLLLHQERAFFLSGILEITGYRVTYLECIKGHRGSSTYTFLRKFKQAINSLISFSNRPLYLLVWMGALATLFSVVASLVLVYRRLAYSSIPDGWTSLLIAMLAMFGIMITALGIVGVYIAKLYEEVKARPNYIVRDTYGKRK